MRRYALISLLFGVLILSFQNCAQDQFASYSNLNGKFSSEESSLGLGDSSENEIGVEAIITNNSETLSAVQNFSAHTYKRPIDMVWVIDNSASMEDSVNSVKSNFKAFIDSLEQNSDIKIALISRSQYMSNVSYKTNMNLSEFTSKGIQVPFMVHSHNPMLVAAAATCPAEPAATDKFCKVVKENIRYKNVYGSLNSFFRDEAQKVFVFVTDDDSTAIASGSTLQFDSANNPNTIDVVPVASMIENRDFITPETFQQRMLSKFSSESNYKVFGFVAFDKKTSPCQFRESKSYNTLIGATRGAAYNVCDASWSSSFNQLTEEVLAYAENKFTVVDNQFVSIKEVMLNGRSLNAGVDYTSEGSRIEINPSLLLQAGVYAVDVIYLRKRDL